MTMRKEDAKQTRFEKANAKGQNCSNMKNSLMMMIIDALSNLNGFPY